MATKNLVHLTLEPPLMGNHTSLDAAAHGQVIDLALKPIRKLGLRYANRMLRRW